MKRMKWDAQELIVNTSDPSHIVWNCEVNNSVGSYGGYVDIDTSEPGYVTVSTDPHEGTAHFPSALIGDVVAALLEIQKRAGNARPLS